MTAAPRFATQRTDRPTHGGAVALMAERLGMPLMPHQRQIADVALEYDPKTNQYVYGVVVVTVQRQAGKTALEGVVAEHRCLTLRNARVWITQQTGAAASAWMLQQHMPMLEQSSFLQGNYRFKRPMGSETVHWPAFGSLFSVFPPKRDALHSKQSDLVFVDEAWVHDAIKGAELKQAIRPTMLTRPGSQLWVLSTMGDDKSEYFDSYVQRGRESVAAGRTEGIAYFDWGIGENDDPEDLDVIAAAHPAYGHTVTRQALEAAREDFGDDVAGWARAYGNRPTNSRTAAFSREVWQRCGDEQPDLPSRFGLAFDCAPDGSRSAVCAAWRDHEGTPRVEVVREDYGTHWVAEFVIALASAHRLPVGYDTAGVQTLAVADQIARLSKGRITTRGLTTQEFATSCATFASLVVDGRLRHSRQRPLDQAIEVASRRPILDGGWAWGRKTSNGSIAPVVAATVALRLNEDMPAARGLTVLTARSA